MDDLISRQAAIDGAVKMFEAWYGGSVLRDREIRARFDALPAAQLEIVRCKDCRWGREVCGNIECFVDINVPPEYHGYEWFCPNGERR